MKKKWLMVTGLALVAAMLVITGCQSTPSGASGTAQINVNSQQQGVWVTGEGKVSVKPDIANLRLGVDSQASTVAEAQEAASTAMDRIMSALKASGIADKDIQTQYFNISRMMRWDNIKQEEVTTGYQVSNIVSAKIRKVDDAGKIIDAAVQAGGDLTRVDSINFIVEDPTEYQNQARDEAIKNAEAKAKQLAAMSGVTLGKATYVSESFSYPVPIMQRVGAVAIQEAAMAETSISPGELEISVNVQIAYAIK